MSSTPAMDRRTILLIEDDELTSMLVSRLFPSNYEVVIARKMSDVERIINERQIFLGFVDLDLEYALEGLDVLRILKRKEIPSIILSARNDKKIIHEAFKIGAVEFLQKPLSEELLNQLLIARELKALSVERKQNQQTTDLINAVVSPTPVLICGESGVGKTKMVNELFSLWENSHEANKGKPFIKVNCSEFSENLLESELFGHVKGAFTGAIKDKKGLLELADGGVLFLDEIGTISLSMQKKLLKAIEERSFFPVGGEKSKKVSFKLVSATCENLLEKVRQGKIREDFYHRIAGLSLTIKPLRERKHEIPLLIEKFLKEKRRNIVFEDNAMDLLLTYSWPGNIRELNHLLESLFLMEARVIDSGMIEELLKKDQEIKEPKALLELLQDQGFIEKFGLVNYIQKLEKDIVDRYLDKNMGKIRKTLEELKISPSVFYRIKGE